MKNILLLYILMIVPFSAGWTQTATQVKYKCTLCSQTFNQDMTGKNPCPRNEKTTNSGHVCSKVN
ncbi:MAG: hypothetical protein EBZ78_01580 [Verrucomicrobia bacterium]|nr:hypothetical protein [Verrucomicrobiota bacterium]